MFELGFLYFEVELSKGGRAWLQVRSRGTQRAVRYWLRRILDAEPVTEVTHIGGW